MLAKRLAVLLLSLCWRDNTGQGLGRSFDIKRCWRGCQGWWGAAGVCHGAGWAWHRRFMVLVALDAQP